MNKIDKEIEEVLNCICKTCKYKSCNRLDKLDFLYRKKHLEETRCGNCKFGIVTSILIFCHKLKQYLNIPKEGRFGCIYWKKK